MTVIKERLQPILIQNDPESPGIVAIIGTLTSIIHENMPLDADGVFTSQILQVSQHKYLVGHCYSDQAGTLLFEFSADGTNFYGDVSKTINAGDKLCFEIRRCGIYMRTTFMNGPTMQSAFDLCVYGE